MTRSRDVFKTREILKKLLAGVVPKRIAYEEGVGLKRISWAKKKYIRETKVLKLNEAGIFLMNEEQLSLVFPVYRVDSRLNSTRTEAARARRKLKGYRKYR